MCVELLWHLWYLHFNQRFKKSTCFNYLSSPSSYLKLQQQIFIMSSTRLKLVNRHVFLCVTSDYMLSGANYMEDLSLCRLICASRKIFSGLNSLWAKRCSWACMKSWNISQRWLKGWQTTDKQSNTCSSGCLEVCEGLTEIKDNCVSGVNLSQTDSCTTWRWTNMITYFK